MPNEALNPESIHRLAEEIKLVFGPAWDQDRAVVLHERLERLAELAEAAGRADLARATLELFVFACSLVEMGRPPVDAVHAELCRLCDGLSDTSSSASAPLRKAAQRKPEPSHASAIVFLASEQEPMLDLAAGLGRAQYLVDRAETTEALSTRLAQRPAELVVLTSSWLSLAADVVSAVDVGCQGRLDRPDLVILLQGDDDEGRMHALRAGIDHVVALGAVDQIVIALNACAGKRRRAAFRVWVVEDDRGQAMFVRSVLGYRGIEVEWAENAEQALALAERSTPDLILLDLHLPDRNGIELAQLLRERPGFEWVQMVFLSGESDREEQVRAIRLGADDWIAKPVRPRHLLSVVGSRAVRARAMRERLGQEVPEEHADRRGRWLREVEQLLLRQSTTPWVLVAVQLSSDAYAGMGFVEAGRLLAEMTQVAASVRGCRSSICTVGDSAVLFVLEGSSARESDLTALLQRWDRRRWLGLDQAKPCGWTVAAFALAAGERRIEPALHRVFILLAHAAGKTERIAFERSAAHSALELPPAWIALLASPAAPKHGAAMMLRFYPLQPVRGSLHDQYLLRPRWRLETGFEVPHEEAVRRAVDTGRLEALERAVLGQSLQVQATLGGRGEQILAWVQVSLETARGDRFPSWLRAEATRRGARLSELTLSFEMDDVLQRPAQADRAWERLAELGIRIALAGIRTPVSALDLLKHAHLQCLVVCCPDPETNIDNALAEVQQLAREYGKTVVVSQVDRAQSLTALFAGSVHYVMGRAVSEGLVTPSFRFVPH